MVIPTGVQNEIMDSPHPPSGSNNMSNQTNCKVCLGLGEVRYNALFSVLRWTAAIFSLPAGFIIDRIGNSRSAILLSLMPLLGSVLFAIGAMPHGPTTLSMYLLMVAGRGILAVGDGTLRVLQARVVAHCFPGATLVPVAFGTVGLVGQSLGYCVTPIIAAAVGLRVSIWLGTVACGFSFMCAVGLVLLLQEQKPLEADDYEKNTIPTLKDIHTLPTIFWLFILTMACIQVPWICKQTNLPDFLELRYGMTVTEAGYIAGVPSFVMLSTPVVSIFLKYIDCHGVVLTAALIWMTSLYVLLGFCPAIPPIILAIADGIGYTIYSMIMWQLLVVISPAAFVGTLGGIFYLVRHLTTALILLAAGYILQKPEQTDVKGALNSYKHFFLMLILMASSSVVLVVMMNVLDFRVACAFNSRIGRWRKSNMESTELLSGIQLPTTYTETMDHTSN
ncbi:uncharacterized protein LOC110453015 isoform X1 [Mizuhopecten yessoensis]|uniref:uncharacterized protein LOC110453015 isoform X1 n=1 Tax=Mizuhopecten yessoensis TaxID=6573 RepID=UPI000B45B530|nr:uncharacterized protein LOC110453015 isoform X1 [Mizuhopecten yessoensis]